MANPIQPFRLLQLVFLAILFSNISVCGNRGPNADEDDAQPLVPFNGKGGPGTPQDHNNRGGSFGWWKKWTECAYNVNNQCMDGPGEEQKVIRSYRILAFCADGNNCEGAKLLFCYPSRLDPSAFPDESSKEPDVTPGRRAMSQITITNDPDHNITKACAKLQEECRKDPACLGTLPEMAKKEKEGEPWHGFLMVRVNNGFDIHMPFGKEGKRFHFMDWISDETPHFYLNFGNKDTPEITFASPYNDDDLVFMFTSDYAKEKYINGRSEGIHLNEALDLWLLGLDILPDEEHQVLRLYTSGFPVVRKWTYCERTNDGLVIGSRNKTAYIDAWFLKPYTPDITVPRRPIRQMDKTIKLVNKNYTQPINTSQGFSRFFVHAQVNDGTKSMSIKIVIGSLEDFKLTLFQFEYNEENGICMIFFQQNMPKNCTKFKFDGVRKSFWIFVDMDKGMVALNCQREYQFNGPMIFPIVDEAKFEITGEGFELFEITQDHKAVSELKSAEYVNQPIFVKLPFQLDKLNILANDIIYFEFNSEMFDTSKFIHFKLIGNNSDSKKNELLYEVVFITKCPEGKKPESIIGTLPKKKMVACVSLKCDGKCAGEFNFLMEADPKHLMKLYLNGKDSEYQFVNRDQIKQISAEHTYLSTTPSTIEHTYLSTTPSTIPRETSYSAYYAQIFGDLILPVQIETFKKAKETTLAYASKNNQQKLTRYEYIIIHGVVFNANGTFSIQYNCDDCKPKTANNQPIHNFLTLNFSLEPGIIESIVPNKMRENQKKISYSKTLNLKMAKPFWIKIVVFTQRIENTAAFSTDNYYQTFVNGQDKELTSSYIYNIYGDDIFVENITVVDKDAAIALVDNIVALPNALKINNTTKNANGDLEISTTFRLLDNGKIVQMFFGSPGSTAEIGSDDTKINSVLGIHNVKEMESRIKIADVIVFAHFLARFDQRLGMYKFCFGQELLFKDGNPKKCDGVGMAQFEYDQNKEGKIVSAKIVVGKDGTIKIDFNGRRVAELKPKDPTNNAAQSTDFVISGDITLVDEPKQKKL